MASLLCRQFKHETFWRYYWRLGDSLPHDHDLEMWNVCKMMYDGLNDETRDQVEIMCNFEFLDQPIERAWEFFEWLAKETYEQEMAHKLPSLDMNHTTFLDHLEANPSCLALKDDYNEKNSYGSLDGSYDLVSEFSVEYADPSYFNGSSALPFSYPCPYPPFEEFDDDDLIYENEDFKEFCMQLRQALNQSCSSIDKALLETSFDGINDELCSSMPSHCEFIIESPCLPYSNESLVFMPCKHDLFVNEHCDHTINVPINKELYVHTYNTLSSETLNIKHCDHPIIPQFSPFHAPFNGHKALPLVGYSFASIDLCQPIPTDFPFTPFVQFFFGFSSCNDKPFFYIYSISLRCLSLFLSICYYLTLSCVGSEFDKLLRSLSSYLLKKV